MLPIGSKPPYQIGATCGRGALGDAGRRHGDISRRLTLIAGSPSYIEGSYRSRLGVVVAGGGELNFSVGELVRVDCSRGDAYGLQRAGAR